MDRLTELAALRDVIKAERPDVIPLEGGDVRLTYRVDSELEEEYVAIEVALPGGWLAEIEDDTYGTLTGVRLYLDD